MAVTPLSPETSTGAVLSVVPPSPSSASPFQPQHLTVPELVSAQVCLSPSASAVTVTPPSPDTVTGTLLFVVPPSPSWPKKLSPQHFTAPELVTAQVWSRPALTATTPLRPETATGTLLSVVPASPSWPLALWPQHLTVPTLVNAQVCSAPTVTAVALWLPAPLSDAD